MRALSIRQPYAEEILRGIKKWEIRSRPTRKIGQTFYIYVGQQPARETDCPARFARLGTTFADLPTGVLVGTAKISKCERANGEYHWHLTDVKRLAQPRKPTGRPQPVWFTPF
jgi:predicted transcriptional regulator